MNWSYFIETNAEKVKLKSPLVGFAFDQLSLTFEKPAQLVLNTDVNHTSRSNFLDPLDTTWGSEVSITDKQINWQINLADRNQQITTFEIVFSDASGKKEVFSLALTPNRYHRDIVFVVGSPRSGTTVVGNAIQRGLQSRAHGESHMAELFQSLTEQASQYVESSAAAQNKGTLAWEVPAIMIKAQLLESFRAIYASFYPQKIIVDKTPGNKMLESLPLLFQVYPNAKVIYCQRRGLENVASRLRKFPGATFEQHCKQWATSVNIWRRSMRKISDMLVINKPWFVEVEQFRLACSPEQELEKVVELLALKRPAKARMLRYINEASPQKTGLSPAHAETFESLDWSPEQQQIFMQWCGDAMTNCGYSLDADYFVTNT